MNITVMGNVATPGYLKSLRIRHVQEFPAQIEQFCHSYVAAQVCAKSVALLLQKRLIYLDHHSLD